MADSKTINRFQRVFPSVMGICKAECFMDSVKTIMQISLKTLDSFFAILRNCSDMFSTSLFITLFQYVKYLIYLYHVFTYLK